MKRPSGTFLLVAILLSILLFRVSRATFPVRDEFPAFYVHKPGYVTIYLGRGFFNYGYRQFIAGVSPVDVIRMAGFVLPVELEKILMEQGALRSGEAIEIVLVDAEVTDVRRFYVHAGQRITLGIPLHPDTMNASDWQALPGIGPRLAERIIFYRQKNGEFGSLEALVRVKGIGKATVKRLSDFF